jgi:hypothetical protein
VPGGGNEKNPPGRQTVQGDSASNRSSPSRLISHFVVHVWLITGGFVALAIPAILLSLAAHYLKRLPVAPLVVNVLYGIHYLLFGLDTVMFGAYLAASSLSAVRELAHYVKSL